MNENTRKQATTTPTTPPAACPVEKLRLSEAPVAGSGPVGPSYCSPFWCFADDE